VRYNWPMSVHASQAFSITHCTDSEDLPQSKNSAGKLFTAITLYTITISEVLCEWIVNVLKLTLQQFSAKVTQNLVVCQNLSQNFIFSL